MKTCDAIARFGGVRQLADALGIWTSAIYQWGENVPELRRYQIEERLRQEQQRQAGVAK
jgi:transcriptional repressor of cell division inhibition gene dicB